MERTLQPVALYAATQPSTAWAWMISAWRIYTHAPIRIFLIAALPILVEGLLQLIPVAGIVVSKLVTPPVGAWVFAMLDAKLTRERFAPQAMAAMCARKFRALAVIAMLSALTFAFQLAITAAIGGADQAIALALGQIAAIELSKPQLAAIFASGVIPSMAVMFVLARMLLDGLGMRDALVDNARAIRVHWKAVTAAGLACAAAIASVLWVAPLLLVILPFSLCIGYASYRVVYHQQAR